MPGNWVLTVLQTYPCFHLFWLRKDDLIAYSLQSEFCQSFCKCELRKSLKNLCSPRGIITRILFVSDAVFQVLKQNIRQVCFSFKSAVRKSQIAWTQNSLDWLTNCKTMPPSGRKLYYTMFLFLVLSSGTFGYTFIHTVIWVIVSLCDTFP